MSWAVTNVIINGDRPFIGRVSGEVFGAMRPGSRLKTRVNGIDYELEVEHITPWLAGLFADRNIRARLVGAPDGLAPAELQSITIENAAMPLPLYLLRGPIAAIRNGLGL